MMHLCIVLAQLAINLLKIEATTGHLTTQAAITRLNQGSANLRAPQAYFPLTMLSKPCANLTLQPRDNFGLVNWFNAARHPA